MTGASPFFITLGLAAASLLLIGLMERLPDRRLAVQIPAAGDARQQPRLACVNARSARLRQGARMDDDPNPLLACADTVPVNADRNIDAGELRVTEQILRLAEMDRHGKDTQRARELLQVLQETLAQWRRYRQAILD
jgi:hypothetical protein